MLSKFDTVTDATHEDDRAAAQKLISERSVMISAPMERMRSVQSSRKWRYGYMGSTFIGASALTYLISARVPAFAVTGSLCSVAAGLVFGSQLHDLHVFVLALVVNEIDDAIVVFEDADRRLGYKSSVYFHEIGVLRRTRTELVPPGTTMSAMLLGTDDVTPQDASTQTRPYSSVIDARVAAIASSYEQRHGPVRGLSDDGYDVFYTDPSDSSALFYVSLASVLMCLSFPCR